MHRVLVVEAHPGTRDALRDLLTAANYRFVGAETASRGETDAQAHKPDLLIANLELPDRDGIELISRVRAWSAVPVIALSSHSSEAQKIAALDAGADDYVTNPFSAAELLAFYKALLGAVEISRVFHGAQVHVRPSASARSAATPKRGRAATSA